MSRNSLPEPDRNGEFEVESILERRVTPDGVYQYRIRWKGYSSEYDTWEPRNCLMNCKKLLEDFERKLNAPKKKRGRPPKQDSSEQDSSSQNSSNQNSSKQDPKKEKQPRKKRPLKLKNKKPKRDVLVILDLPPQLITPGLINRINSVRPATKKVLSHTATDSGGQLGLSFEVLDELTGCTFSITTAKAKEDPDLMRIIITYLESKILQNGPLTPPISVVNPASSQDAPSPELHVEFELENEPIDQAIDLEWGMEMPDPDVLVHQVLDIDGQVGDVLEASYTEHDLD